MSAVGEDALDCAGRGWSVVPVRGKNPGGYVGAGWQHKATTDPVMIRAWWRRWPEANVGVVVGETFLGLDVDHRNGDDDRLHDLEGSLGPLPRTPSYTTSDGWRSLFKHPGGELRHDIDDVEVKHGSQMIVMPRSVHPDGSIYEWDDHPAEVELAPLPEAYLDLLRSVPALVRAPAVEHHDDPLREITAVEYVGVLTGRNPNRRGYITCPFHAGGTERTPSLKLYGTGWACFGCAGPGPRGKLGGSIYTFAARLWDYPLPLRGPAFIVVQSRLLDVFAEHYGRAAA